MIPRRVTGGVMRGVRSNRVSYIWVTKETLGLLHSSMIFVTSFLRNRFTDAMYCLIAANDISMRVTSRQYCLTKEMA
jgi:hypothetical protein